MHAIVWPVLAILLIGGGFAAFSLYNDAMSVRADLEDAQASVAAFHCLTCSMARWPSISSSQR